MHLLLGRIKLLMGLLSGPATAGGHGFPPLHGA